MTTKHDVIQIHRKHPQFSAPEIAAVLGCTSAYVRATAQRNRLSLPKGRCIHGITALGRAARAAGLTITDIEAIAKSRVVHSRAMAAATA